MYKEVNRDKESSLLPNRTKPNRSAMMILSALFLVGLYQYGAAVNEHCPAHLPKNDFLREFDSHCYEFVLDHPGDWHHAERDCLSRGGYLTDIHSYAEQAFLMNSMQLLGFHDDKGVWIGLTDQIVEGKWTWASQVPMNFVNWAPGQPGLLAGTEDCGLMEFSDHGLWHDYPCQGLLFLTENHGWICKYTI